jgi:hypothetical protein
MDGPRKIVHFSCWDSRGATPTGTRPRKRPAPSLPRNADGGWAQLPTLGSDAYAAGEALTALHSADYSLARLRSCLTRRLPW